MAFCRLPKNPIRVVDNKSLQKSRFWVVKVEFSFYARGNKGGFPNPLNPKACRCIRGAAKIWKDSENLPCREP